MACSTGMEVRVEVRERTLPIGEVLGLALEAAEGLEAVHERAWSTATSSRRTSWCRGRAGEDDRLRAGAAGGRPAS